MLEELDDYTIRYCVKQVFCRLANGSVLVDEIVRQDDGILCYMTLNELQSDGNIAECKYEILLFEDKILNAADRQSIGEKYEEPWRRYIGEALENL